MGSEIMTVTFGFEVIGTEYVDIEVDDEEIEGMTEEEIVDYVQDTYWTEAESEAQQNCDYGLGQIETINFDGKEHWVGV